MEPVERKTLLLLIALLLLSSGVRRIHCSVHENSTDMLILIDFKHTVSDPTGALVSWNRSTPFCMWEGVTCSPKNPGRVTILDLYGRGLGGRITPSLGNLTFMKELNLSSNEFFGSLPHLNYAQELLALDLSENSLEGEIPTSFMNLSNLRVINLSSNNLKGLIPLEIGLLHNLLRLDLSRNNLNGVIPPTVKNTTYLIELLLQSNSLAGTIPAEVGTLSNLTALILFENRLSGAVPPAVFHLPSLLLLDLGSNMLDDTLPANIGDILPNSIQWLLFGGNKFKGRIPASLGNALRLNVVDLSYNHFIGRIPSSFGNLSGLSFLSLDKNDLEAKDNVSWEFLYALRNCSFLQVLSIEENRLQGTIPGYVGDLKSLEQLFFDGNDLSGAVPSSIGNLSSLILLNLSNNKLTGTIGDWVGKIKELQVLRLEENTFTEPLPDAFVNLTSLSSLHLAKNEFDGLIPPSLGNLSHLAELDLSYNNLKGDIPKEVFRATTLTKLLLSTNNIEGSIPSEIGDLTQLIELSISSNKLTGEIPASLGRCQELQIIRMDKNKFTGSIPMSLGDMPILNILNLSYNNISGSIPTAINHLQVLNSLDLSYNHLEGEIPRHGIFENATAVSLNGNRGLCGGVTDLHMPACPTDSRGIEWKHYLILLLILISGFMSLVTSVYIIFLRKKTSKRPYLLILSFGKKFPRVSYKDLAQATENFSEFNLIGSGSYGSVYQGKISQAKIKVAIKVFHLDTSFANKSFVSECEVLRTIRHRNLLPVLTACSAIDNRGNDFKALVYEFMHNGSLDTWLHQKIGSVDRELLSLAQRIRIAVDVADALVYLHYDCGRRIVHCDVKPTNILLDDEMNAYLGDFGIASLLSDSTTVGNSGYHSVIVTGTIGYIPPEYAQSVHASTCGDVYSFGIVLLEMLVGKRPTDSMFDGERNIVSFVERNFRDQILQIIDANLHEECGNVIRASETHNEIHRCLLSLMQVALSCTRWLPRERVNMREVAVNLHAIRRSYVAAIKADHASPQVM